MNRLMFAVAGVALLAGCQSPIDHADPAARSARAQYTFGNIQVEGGSTFTLTMGDGSIAAADGNGDVTQPSSFTHTPSMTFTTPVGMDPISAAISTVGQVAVKGIDAYTATHTSGAKANKAAAGTDDCPGGDCDKCTDGSCGECTDGSCSIK